MILYNIKFYIGLLYFALYGAESSSCIYRLALFIIEIACTYVSRKMFWPKRTETAIVIIKEGVNKKRSH